jgi:restriction system protein
MAEITIARTGAHLRKLFEILIGQPDGLQAGEALKKLAASVQLTPYEAGVYESTGTPRFEKIVRFATIDCSKAGWLAKNKGVWSITDAGKKAFSDYPDPEKFYREAIKLYQQWKASAGTTEEAESLEELTLATKSKAAASVTYEEAEEQAWNEIENYLRLMPAYEMQDLVSDLLKALGYYVEWVAPPGRTAGSIL